MAAAPRFKVYDAGGVYIASCKYPQDAAAIVAARGSHGTQIRDGHVRVVWTDGVDGDASESYDAVARRCLPIVAGEGGRDI